MGKAHSSNSARGPEVKGFRKPEFPQGGTEKTKNTNSATVWNEQRKSSVILEVSRFTSPSKGEGEWGEGEAELPGRKRDETTRGAGMEGCGCKFAPQPHRTSGLLCHLRSVIFLEPAIFPGKDLCSSLLSQRLPRGIKPHQSRYLYLSSAGLGWGSGSWPRTRGWPGPRTCPRSRRCARSCCWTRHWTRRRRCSRSGTCKQPTGRKAMRPFFIARHGWVCWEAQQVMIRKTHKGCVSWGAAGRKNPKAVGCRPRK